MTFSAQAMAATLRPGVLGVSHGAAARLHRLAGFEHHPHIEVIGARGSHIRVDAPIFARYSRRPIDQHIGLVGAIRVTSIPLTLALATPEITSEQAADTLTSALRRGVPAATIRAVAEQWHGAGRARPIRLLELLDRLGGEQPPVGVTAQRCSVTGPIISSAAVQGSTSRLTTASISPFHRSSPHTARACCSRRRAMISVNSSRIRRERRRSSMPVAVACSRWASTASQSAAHARRRSWRLCARSAGASESRVVVAVERAGQVEHLLEVAPGLVGARAVGLVDDEHVGDFHQAGLVRLHAVAPAGIDHDDGRIGLARHLHLDLADADGLDEDEVVADRIEQPDGLRRRQRETSEVPPRGHRTDEHPGVGGVVLHPHPVAEDRPARERRRRVDGEHGDGTAAGPELGDDRTRERALACARVRRSGPPCRRRRPAARRAARPRLASWPPRSMSESSRASAARSPSVAAANRVSGSLPGRPARVSDGAAALSVTRR